MSPTAAGAQLHLDEIVNDLCREALGARRSPPVDLRLIADHLGVRIAPPTQGLAVEGRLALRGHEAVIERRGDVGVGRQRFTIAHELAHAFLLHPRRAVAVNPDHHGGEERFCNNFAAALLMPRDWLQEFADSRPTLQALFDGALVARTSSQALSRRLIACGVWDTGLLSIRRQGGSWAVTNWAGVPPYRLSAVDVSFGSAHRLKTLAAGTVPARLRLQLNVRRHEVEVEGEARVTATDCLMLTPPPAFLR